MILFISSSNVRQYTIQFSIKYMKEVASNLLGIRVNIPLWTQTMLALSRVMI